MRIGSAFAFVLLSSCSADPQPPDSDRATEVEEAEAPTSYYVRDADLYRVRPNDICRSRNPDFIKSLVSDVLRKIPVEFAGSVSFEDFNAHSALNGDGMEAVARFRIIGGRYSEQMIYAVGPFDPASCKFEVKETGIGSTPYGADSQPF